MRKIVTTALIASAAFLFSPAAETATTLTLAQLTHTSEISKHETRIKALETKLAGINHGTATPPVSGGCNSKLVFSAACNSQYATLPMFR